MRPVDSIIELICGALPDVVAVYLFGSRLDPARVDAHSDWDLAVLASGGGMAPREWWALKCRLESMLNIRKVDLVDLKRADFVIRDTVLRESRLLYCGDEAARISWEIASEKLVEEWLPVYEATWAAYWSRVTTTTGGE